MNNVINNFLLAGDKFTPEMHLRQPQLTYIVLVEHLLNINKEIKSLKKLVIQTIYTKMNWIKLVLLMMMRILIVNIL